jgi:6-phosphogluconolactonase
MLDLMTPSHVASLLYVGCYTNESPAGIGVYDSSDPDGRLVQLGVVDGVEQASFLAAHPNRRVLYAVSETTLFDGMPGGGLVSFRIDPTDGSLSPLDRVSSHGDAPCHVSVDPAGRFLYVANYLSGTIAAFGLDPQGRVGDVLAVHRHRGSGPNPHRQQGPHAHCIVPGPDGASVYATDLGIDRVIHYRHAEPDRTDGGGFEARGELALEPGSGPRHLAFHPHHPVAFLICELSSTIVTLAVDTTTGELEVVGSRSTLPDGFDGASIGAEIRVDGRGRGVYASNRGHDSVAVFAFTGPCEPLEPLGLIDSGGRTPRNFALHPSGRAMLVANQDSDTIVRFTLDPRTGMPRPTDTTIELSQPVCLTFVPVAR